MKMKMSTMVLVMLALYAMGSFAALTYNQDFYNKNRRTALSASENDPIYMFIGEVDTQLTAFGVDGSNMTVPGTLAVTGESTLTGDLNVTGDPNFVGAVTAIAGIQAGSVAVTAEAEAEQATIPAGTSWATVTITNDADDAVCLPAAVIGNIIRIVVPVTGCELQTLATGSDTINGVDCSGANEMAMAAGSVYTLTCMKANTWIATGVGDDGAHQATIVPDADS